MLNDKEFSEEIRTQVAERLGEGYRVEVKEYRKANEGLVKGLIILKCRENTDVVSPNFNLSLLFGEYISGKDIDVITEGIIRTYHEQEADAGEMIQGIRNIGNYENCKERIYFRLVSTEKNRLLLEEVPHFEMLDLSMIFYVLIREDEKGLGSLMVRNGMLEVWDISLEEIKRQAEKNTVEMFPVKIQSMRSVVAEICGKNHKEERESGIQEPEEEELEQEKMFIMTNQKMLNGFSAVLYPGVLKEFADRIGRNLYVLPSSIHESILIRAESSVTAQELYAMVREVNATAVAAEEVVSDSVYFYDRGRDRLMLAKGEEKYV